MLESDVSYSIYYQQQYMHIAFGIIHVVNVSLQSILALYLHTLAHYLNSEINALTDHPPTSYLEIWYLVEFQYFDGWFSFSDSLLSPLYRQKGRYFFTGL